MYISCLSTHDEERRRLLFWQNHIQGLVPGLGARHPLPIMWNGFNHEQLAFALNKKHLPPANFSDEGYRMLEFQISHPLIKNNSVIQSLSPLPALPLNVESDFILYQNHLTYLEQVSIEPLESDDLYDQEELVQENRSEKNHISQTEGKQGAADPIITTLRAIPAAEGKIESIEHPMPVDVLDAADESVEAISLPSREGLINIMRQVPHKSAKGQYNPPEIKLSVDIEDSASMPKILIDDRQSQSKTSILHPKSNIKSDVAKVIEVSVPSSTHSILPAAFVQTTLDKQSLAVSSSKATIAADSHIEQDPQKIRPKGELAASRVKIYGIKDLVQAIYDDNFDLVAEIINNQNNLLTQKLMQLGKDFVCPEGQKLQFLASNEKGSTWISHTEREINLRFDAVRDVARIFDEDSDDEGEVTLSFVKYVASNSQELKAVNFTTSSSPAQISISERINFDSMFQNNISPLHLACILGARNAAASLILVGANPNYQDKEGFTAMHHAVMHGNLDTVAILCSYYDVSDEKISYRDQETPSLLAAYTGDREIFDCIMSGHLKLITIKHLMQAIKGRSFEMVEHILQISDFIDGLSANHIGRALLCSIKQDNLKIFEALLDLGLSKGLNLNFTYKGKNIFHYIAKSPKAAYMAELVVEKLEPEEAGQLLAQLDKGGNIPLHIAAHHPTSYLPFKFICAKNLPFKQPSKTSFFKKMFSKTCKVACAEILNLHGQTAEEIYQECIGENLAETAL